MHAPLEGPGPDHVRVISTAMAGRIVEALGTEEVGRVLLYGSRARGDAGPESDWDLLVVVEDADLTRKSRGELRRACKRGLGRLRSWTDVRVVGRSEFERGREARGSLAEAADSAGDQVYPNSNLGEGFFEDTEAIRSSYRKALSLLER